VIHPQDQSASQIMVKLAAEAAKMPSQEASRSRPPADFQVDRDAGQALDGPGKVNGPRFTASTLVARREDCDACTIACLRRTREDLDDTAAKAVKGVRPDRSARRRRSRRGGSHGCRGKKAWLRSRSSGEGTMPAHHGGRCPRPRTGDARSGAVAQNLGDADKAIASAATKVEATYQVPFWRMPRWSR